MIRNWKISNFKSIRDDTELDFAPLTVFAGANSSGKSTFIQTILLVAQTLANRSDSQIVELNGKFTKLGQFDDIKSDGGKDDHITIRFSCIPMPRQISGSGMSEKVPTTSLTSVSSSNQFQKIDCELSFGLNTTDPKMILQQQIHPRFVSSELTCFGRDEENIDQSATISVRFAEKSISQLEGMFDESEFDDELRSSLINDVRLDNFTLGKTTEIFQTANPIGCKMNFFLPSQILLSVNSIDEYAKAITDQLRNFAPISGRSYHKIKTKIYLHEEIIQFLFNIIDDDEFRNTVQEMREHTLFGLSPLEINQWHEILDSLPEHKKIEIFNKIIGYKGLFKDIRLSLEKFMNNSQDIIEMNPPKIINESVNYIKNFFTTSLKYLGPLREAPKTMYPLEIAEIPRDVGIQGEQTASILELHKNDMVRYVPTACFIDPSIERKISTRTLETAVIDWLSYLGVANSVESQLKGKLGHELKVGFSDSKHARDLTHVGVGVSQVLPILVLGLLANRDSTLVFEQPELHLHPKVQTMLGDFFMSLIFCEKQCIVETHSEYLVDRLRFRIASAPPNKELVDLAKVYFVEKPSQESIFKEVVINRFGAISDWPEDFFDQSQLAAEQILISATKKQKLIRNAENEK